MVKNNQQAAGLLQQLVRAGILSALILGLLPVHVPVWAIVIRHDTGYARHFASESAYPAVFYLEQRARRRICVATLIAPGWALTAAHCTEETPLKAVLASGKTYEVSIAGRQIQIDAAILHPDYHYRYEEDAVAPDVDLALLHLAGPLEDLRTIPLYTGQDEQDKVVTLLGWGYFGIGTRGIQVDDGRFRLARNVIDEAAERLHFAFDDPRGVDSAAIELEGLPGLGDSGGPALIDTPEGPRLAGVAIGELGAIDAAGQQGRYGAKGIYERVSLHLEWIEQTMMQAVTESRAADTVSAGEF